MARAQNVLRHCRDDNKTFFRFVFVYSQSRKWNGNKTTIPEVVFACFAMLSVSLYGTFNWVAVHENDTKNVLLSFLQCFNTFGACTMWGNGFQKFDPSYWVGGEGRWFCVRGSENIFRGGTRNRKAKQNLHSWASLLLKVTSVKR